MRTVSNLARGAALLLAGLLLLAGPARAQQVVLEFQPASKLWIEGQSNQNSFTINAEELTGHLTLDQAAVPSVSEAVVTVPAAKLTGGRSTIMDRLMQDALKMEEHPEISYTLTSAEAKPGTGGAFTLTTTGDLTLAGVTKPIEMVIEGKREAGGQIRFTSSYELLMSDYGMEPPTAMFGALRVANPVTIHFDVVAAPAVN